MSEMMAVLSELAASLASLLAKGSGSAIEAKIKAIGAEKDAAAIKAKYDEIVNQLISEREEALRIAQAYKAEIDRLVISDEDITHLHNTVRKVLQVLKTMTPVTPPVEIESITELISVDTLKTMQLLGFNYKAAIGEPLTKLCAEAILSIAKRGSHNAIPGSGKGKGR